jgi:hypothetical protein
MNHETNELLPAEWAATWRGAQTPRLDEVIRKTRALTRRQAVQVLIELAGAVIGMAFLIRFAAANLHPADRPFAVLYAMAVAVLGWFAVYNTWGTWRPQGETPLDHARLHALRAERRIQSARAAFVFLGMSTLLYTPWILYRVQGRGRVLGAFAFLALIVGFYAFALRRTLRGAATERAAWSDVCAQLGE